MGQITQNIVARNIYMTSLDARGLGSSISASNAGGSSLFAPNQAAAALQGQGLKDEYFWGLYCE